MQVISCELLKFLKLYFVCFALDHNIRMQTAILFHSGNNWFILALCLNYAYSKDETPLFEVPPKSDNPMSSNNHRYFTYTDNTVTSFSLFHIL
jgi:hypothetical protein